MAWALTRDPERFKGAACLLAIALQRGDQIRNRAGWLVRAFRIAGDDEHLEATKAVLKGGAA
jgi:hypothetical protein